MKLSFKYRIFLIGSLAIAIYLMHGLTQYSLKLFNSKQNKIIYNYYSLNSKLKDFTISNLNYKMELLYELESLNKILSKKLYNKSEFAIWYQNLTKSREYALLSEKQKNTLKAISTKYKTLYNLTGILSISRNRFVHFEKMNTIRSLNTSFDDINNSLNELFALNLDTINSTSIEMTKLNKLLDSIVFPIFIVISIFLFYLIKNLTQKATNRHNKISDDILIISQGELNY